MIWIANQEADDRSRRVALHWEPLEWSTLWQIISW